MPSHGGQIPYEKRVSVVVLRLLCGMTFATIAEKLDLELRSVHHIYSRAIQRSETGPRDSFLDVARNVKDAVRSGRPAIIPEGSPATAQLRQLILEHSDLPIEVVTSYIVCCRNQNGTLYSRKCGSQSSRILQQGPCSGYTAD